MSGAIVFIERPQLIQCPDIVLFRLAAKKGKAYAEGSLARIHSYHVEEWHAMLVGLVRAIEQ